MTIIGYRKVNFTTKDNQVINGYRIYVKDSLRGKDCAGEIGDNFFLSDSKVDDLFPIHVEDSIGSEIDVFYNRYGKIANINFL